MNRAPIRSMTGYGDAERDLDMGRLRVEIRTVNHKHLNIRIRTPGNLDRHLRAMERGLGEHFARGNVDVSVMLDRSVAEASGQITVDVARAQGYAEALQRLGRELGIEGTPDLGLIARFRDIFGDGRDEVPELPEQEVFDLLDIAASRVVQMRVEEGERLAEDLESRLSRMEDLLGEIETRAPERLVAERDRLRTAISELLGGDFEVDEERLAREVAHLAERWDIHEELVRFRSHLEMFRETLVAGDSAGVGKRFGFIAQEMLREANTIGSKANDSEIARRVIGLKEEIDRVREQLENVE